MTKREIDVLIVDDDHITRMIHTRVLKSIKEYNFNIQEARNGMEALEILSEKQTAGVIPYLILLDNNMPVLSGFDFLEKFSLLDSYTQVHVMLVSASDFLEDKRKAEKLGIKYYLIKPLSIAELKLAIVDTIKG